MRCRNPSCKTDNGKRAKLPKDTLPAVCCDACRDVVIADAIAKSNKAAERARAKARNVKAREERELRRQCRARKLAFIANDLPHQIDLTQRKFNEMIRLLDRGKLCPTCWEPLVDGQYDAGHTENNSRIAHCILRLIPSHRLDVHAASLSLFLGQSGT